MDKNLLDSEYKRSVRLGAPTDRFIVQANHILDVIINLYRFMPNVYYHKCRSYAFTYMVNTSVKNKNHPLDTFSYLCDLAKIGVGTKHQVLMSATRRTSKIKNIVDKI